MKRRDALVLGGLVAAALALPPVLRRLPSDFDFQPVPGLAGFRRLAGGGASASAALFAGLDEAAGLEQAEPVTVTDAEVCRLLYGAAGWRGDPLPLAVFSDFNCPYCRLFETQVTQVAAADGALRLVWHEYPLLGPLSERKARAMIAARKLGQEDAASELLWNSNLPPGPVGLNRMAQALGLDPDALRRTAESAEVGRTLAESLALGRRFGIVGTPAIVVGRTLVVGALKPADLKKLVDLERREAQNLCL